MGHVRITWQPPAIAMAQSALEWDLVISSKERATPMPDRAKLSIFDYKSFGEKEINY